MVEHVNVPPQKQAAQEAPQLSSEQLALQLLATELHRPPQSLAAFSHLTADQLAWLTARVALICMREDTRLRDELNHAIPRCLRSLLLGRLRGSS